MMMVNQTFVIALLLGLGNGQQRAVDLSAEKIYEYSSPAVAKIVTQTLAGTSASGSGFLFAPNRLATCWHVVSDAKSVTVQFPGSEPMQAKIVDANAEADYAVLSVATKVKPLNLRSEQPKPGERLYVVGAPLGLSGSILEGLMSQARLLESAEVYQISAPITFGYSGGPVLDSRARVVGMATSGISGIQSISFAVPAKTLGAARTELAPIDFDSFREERLSGWYTLIDRPIEGDEIIRKVRMEANLPSGPEKGKHVFASTTSVRVFSVNDQEVVRETTDLEITHEKDGMPAVGGTDKRNAERVTTDLFGVVKGHREALAGMDWTKEVAFRTVFDYFPETIGCLIKVGQTWTVNFPQRGKVPSGKYTARFVGFEVVKGIRCAKIESVFDQSWPDGERMTVERTRWLVRGGIAIRKIEKTVSGGTTATDEAEVVYWKLGPDALRNKPRI